MTFVNVRLMYIPFDTNLRIYIDYIYDRVMIFESFIQYGFHTVAIAISNHQHHFLFIPNAENASIYNIVCKKVNNFFYYSLRSSSRKKMASTELRLCDTHTAAD